MISIFIYGLFFIGFGIYETIYLKNVKLTGELQTGFLRKWYKRADNVKEFEKKIKRATVAQYMFYALGILLIIVYFGLKILLKSFGL